MTSTRKPGRRSWPAGSRPGHVDVLHHSESGRTRKDPPLIDGIAPALGVAVGTLLGIVAHEFATAAMADRLGDKVPRMRGRLTLSPRAHLDPLGSMVLPAVFIVAALFGALAGLLIVPFAYGRKHDLNPLALRGNRRTGTILVSLAGPAVTLILALATSALAGDAFPCSQTARMFDAATYVLVTMTVIELVPLPGRDGGRILQLFLPSKGAMKMGELSEHDAAFVILFLVILGVLAFRMVTTLLHPVLGQASCL